MICPKCGTTQADGRQDCSKCGIVFARWNPTQRPRTLSTIPLPPETPKEHTPVSLVIVGVFVAILIGLVWTKHRREHSTPGVDGDAMINKINNEQIAKAKARQAKLDEEAKRQQALLPQPHAADARLPAGLDEAAIRGMIEACPFFNERVIATLPKSFSATLYDWTMQHYPSLPMAVTDHLVELQRGPTIFVKITAPSTLRVRESGDDYEMDVGQRRIENVTAAQVYESFVRVGFTWTTDRPEGADLVPEGRDRSGEADIERIGSRWALRGAWRIHGGRSEMLTCP